MASNKADHTCLAHFTREACELLIDEISGMAIKLNEFQASGKIFWGPCGLFRVLKSCPKATQLPLQIWRIWEKFTFFPVLTHLFGGSIVAWVSSDVFSELEVNDPWSITWIRKLRFQLGKWIYCNFRGRWRPQTVLAFCTPLAWGDVCGKNLNFSISSVDCAYTRPKTSSLVHLK